MNYLNVKLGIIHRHLTTESVYLNREIYCTKKAYLGNFYFSMSSETPLEVDLNCVFNTEYVGWRVKYIFKWFTIEGKVNISE